MSMGARTPAGGEAAAIAGSAAGSRPGERGSLTRARLAGRDTGDPCKVLAADSDGWDRRTKTMQGMWRRSAGRIPGEARAQMGGETRGRARRRMRGRMAVERLRLPGGGGTRVVG